MRKDKSKEAPLTNCEADALLSFAICSVSKEKPNYLTPIDERLFHVMTLLWGFALYNPDHRRLFNIFFIIDCLNFLYKDDRYTANMVTPTVMKRFKNGLGLDIDCFCHNEDHVFCFRPPYVEWLFKYVAAKYMRRQDGYIVDNDFINLLYS